MHRGVHWLIAVLLLLGCSVPGMAGIRPSFMLDYSSWHSTDVVLVAATARGGEFEVIESWKGDTHPRDHISIPELKPNTKAIPVSLYPDDWFPREVAVGVEIPKQIAGSQLLLFLKRNSPTAPTKDEKQSVQPRWMPSSLFNDMKSSVVWIDGSRLYRFIQTVNPGPSTLQPWDMTEGRLRERVAQVVQLEQQLTDVVRIKDGAERADALKPYVRSDILPARQFAEEELGKCAGSMLGLASVAAARCPEPNPSWVVDDRINGVISVDGRPLKEAKIRLSSSTPTQHYTAVTDGEGAFLIPNVVVGRYSFVVKGWGEAHVQVKGWHRGGINRPVLLFDSIKKCLLLTVVSN